MRRERANYSRGEVWREDWCRQIMHLLWNVMLIITSAIHVTKTTNGWQTSTSSCIWWWLRCRRRSIPLCRERPSFAPPYFRRADRINQISFSFVLLSYFIYSNHLILPFLCTLRLSIRAGLLWVASQQREQQNHEESFCACSLCLTSINPSWLILQQTSWGCRCCCWGCW